MLCYKTLLGVQFISTVVSVALHALDIVHAAGLLFYHHILFVIHSFFFAYILYAGTKKNKNRRKLYTIGLMIVLASIAYELIDYVLGRYR